MLVDLRSLPLQQLLQHERETRTNLGEEGFSRVLFQALLLKAQPRPRGKPRDLHLCARCETAASSGLQSTMHQLLEIKMRGWDKSNEGFLRPLERIDTSLTLSRTWFISL